MVRPQIQSGYHDCGLFALAFSMSLVTGQDVFNIIFDQAEMRRHLEECFVAKHTTAFPLINSH